MGRKGTDAARLKAFAALYGGKGIENGIESVRLLRRQVYKIEWSKPSIRVGRSHRIVLLHITVMKMRQVDIINIYSGPNPKWP